MKLGLRLGWVVLLAVACGGSTEKSAEQQICEQACRRSLQCGMFPEGAKAEDCIALECVENRPCAAELAVANECLVRALEDCVDDRECVTEAEAVDACLSGAP